jgi:hypothetical protein
MRTDQNKEQEKDQSLQEPAKNPRSGAFNEPDRKEEKSTANVEQEADLEQERKEAMTERD